MNDFPAYTYYHILERSVDSKGATQAVLGLAFHSVMRRVVGDTLNYPFPEKEYKAAGRKGEGVIAYPFLLASMPEYLESSASFENTESLAHMASLMGMHRPESFPVLFMTQRHSDARLESDGNGMLRFASDTPLGKWLADISPPIPSMLQNQSTVEAAAHAAAKKTTAWAACDSLAIWLAPKSYMPRSGGDLRAALNNLHFQDDCVLYGRVSSTPPSCVANPIRIAFTIGNERKLQFSSVGARTRWVPDSATPSWHYIDGEGVTPKPRQMLSSDSRTIPDYKRQICLVCGQSPVTKEHVIPEWVSRYSQAAEFAVHLLCQGCNSAFGGIDSSVAPSFFSDTAEELDPGLLRLWTYKTFLLTAVLCLHQLSTGQRLFLLQVAQGSGPVPARVSPFMQRVAAGAHPNLIKFEYFPPSRVINFHHPGAFRASLEFKGWRIELKDPGDSTPLRPNRDSEYP